MFKIEGTAEKNKVGKEWVVYILRDATTATPVYLGYCRLSQFFGFPDAKMFLGADFPERFIYQILSMHENKVMANIESEVEIGKHGLSQKLMRLKIDHSSSWVECIETGEQWPTIVEACRAHGMNIGNLSNHLRGVPGFVSVKGKHYRRAPWKGVQQTKPAAPVAPPPPQRVTGFQQMQPLPWVATADFSTRRVNVWQGVSASKDVIASGTRENVCRIAHKWLVDFSDSATAATFAADWGVY